LQQLVSKRQQLAELLGFESYPERAYIENMVKTPQKLQDFENKLLSQVQKAGKA
jgi:Zn-dependent oligopeptidase